MCPSQALAGILLPGLRIRRARAAAGSEGRWLSGRWIGSGLIKSSSARAPAPDSSSAGSSRPRRVELFRGYQPWFRAALASEAIPRAAFLSFSLSLFLFSRARKKPRRERLALWRIERQCSCVFRTVGSDCYGQLLFHDSCFVISWYVYVAGNVCRKWFTSLRQCAYCPKIIINLARAKYILIRYTLFESEAKVPLSARYEEK